jgi:GntR family transcriptional regulator, sialic acid-inducible nan operon repressor
MPPKKSISDPRELTVHPPAGPEPTRRLYQDIAEKIAERINAGEFAGGTRLPSERDLASMFSASRTAVREALLYLQSSGLVSIRQRARARVTELDDAAFFGQLSGAARSLMARPSGLSDFQEARMLFEGGLARYAAQHATPKHLEKLASALLENKRSMTDPAQFVKTDMAFHLAIAEIPQNSIFTALHNALSEWLIDQRKTGITVRGSTRSAYQGHERIFQAISSHNVEAAGSAMDNHLTTIAKFYWTAKAQDRKAPG